MIYKLSSDQNSFVQFFFLIRGFIFLQMFDSSWWYAYL